MASTTFLSVNFGLDQQQTSVFLMFCLIEKYIHR